MEWVLWEMSLEVVQVSRVISLLGKILGRERDYFNSERK